MSLTKFNRVNFKKSQKGLSLLELMVAMSIMGIAAYIGSGILQDVTKEGIFAERRSQVAQIVSELTRASNIFVARVVPNGFDPIYTSDFNNSRLGPNWYSSTDTTSNASSQGKWVYKKHIDIGAHPSNNNRRFDSFVNSSFQNEGCTNSPDVAHCDVAHCVPPTNLRSWGRLGSVPDTPSVVPDTPSVVNVQDPCSDLGSCYCPSDYQSSRVGWSHLSISEDLYKCEKSTDTTQPLNSQPTSVPLLTIDKFNGAQKSHDLVLTSLIFKKSDGSTTIQNTGAYLSRCVPAADLAKVDSDYQQYDKIDQLKRPFISNASGSIATSTVATSTGNQTVKTYVAPEIKCCDLAKDITQPLMSNCEFISNNVTASYYPTVFLYRGENKVSAIPNAASRRLVPGMAMVLRFDNAANPQSFDLSVLQIENACMTGRKRAFWPCDSNPSNELVPKDGEFNNQTEIKVITKSGTPTSDVSGSGIIKLGTRAVFDNK